MGAVSEIRNRSGIPLFDIVNVQKLDGVRVSVAGCSPDAQRERRLFVNFPKGRLISRLCGPGARPLKHYGDAAAL
jgi:hypothetical protein